MDIKDFVKDKVKDLPHAISSTTMKGTEYGYTLMTSEIEDIAKEYALEMLNEYIDKINELIPDFKEYYADSEYFPSQLTATKLEGEK